MNTEEFDYYLPEELIAQTPLKDRSASRLMVLDRKTGQIEHRIFKDIVNYLDENDVLVLMILRLFLLDYLALKKIQRLILNF